MESGVAWLPSVKAICPTRHCSDADSRTSAVWDLFLNISWGPWMKQFVSHIVMQHASQTLPWLLSLVEKLPLMFSSILLLLSDWVWPHLSQRTFVHVIALVNSPMRNQKAQSSWVSVVIRALIWRVVDCCATNWHQFSGLNTFIISQFLWARVSSG